MSTELQTESRRTLMVVDDDSATREIIETIVQSEGYPVVTAADGNEALSHLRSGLKPGVILLDLRMPGMDGQTFREVQRSDPMLAGIPIVILSGDRDASGLAARLGADCIPKPIDLDRLLSVAKNFCGRSLLDGAPNHSVRY